MEPITVTAENVEATIIAAEGGRVQSIRAYGQELLRPRTKNPMGWGCYPMVPFAGRIADGTFNFDNSTYQLPPTMGPHAIHGYGYNQPWRVTETTPTSCTTRWDFTDPWPWPGYATQRMQAFPNRIELSITATASKRQPLSIGFHPWFNQHLTDQDELTLLFDADEMYELDDRAIPTGRTQPPKEPPWDNCFRSLKADPVLRWGQLEATMSATTDHWVVYTEPADATCVEPQTGPPDEVNRSPKVFEAGQQLTLTTTLNIRRMTNNL